ncbi:3-keto-5-aminohexanoate cleavage enzyme [subsurface metagenome]
MAKVIVTAAITGGIHTPSMSPYLPITPKQIADEAVRAYEAGAAVVHIHSRNPETGKPVSDVGVMREIVTSIKSRCNVVVCITTGGGLGMTVEERLQPVPSLKPELASCNFGSINFNISRGREIVDTFKYDWEAEYLEMTKDLIFPNTFKSLEQYLKTFASNGTKPEIEIYDTGMIYNLAHMIQEGHINKPVYLQFVLGILGSIQPSPSNLVFLHTTAREVIGDFIWSVCAAGRAQIPMCTMALIMGGNARVGLEDSLYISKGVMAKSNAEQVEKIVSIAQALNMETATPETARGILGLKGLAKVNY